MGNQWKGDLREIGRAGLHRPGRAGRKPRWNEEEFSQFATGAGIDLLLRTPSNYPPGGGLKLSAVSTPFTRARGRDEATDDDVCYDCCCCSQPRTTFRQPFREAAT